MKQYNINPLTPGLPGLIATMLLLLSSLANLTNFNKFGIFEQFKITLSNLVSRLSTNPEFKMHFDYLFLDVNYYVIF